MEAFLGRKWQREHEYHLIKEIWSCRENRIAVRFVYDRHNEAGQWFRSFGNENWEFDEHGLMRVRLASIDNLAIAVGERNFRWPRGRRPGDHLSLCDLGSVMR